jgi:hypothetical protein
VRYEFQTSALAKATGATLGKARGPVIVSSPRAQSADSVMPIVIRLSISPLVSPKANSP